MSAIYTLRECSLQEARRKRKGGGKHDNTNQLIDLLYEFIAKGYEAAEISELTGFHSNGNNLRRQLQHIIEMVKLPIVITMRGNSVYLIKKELTEAEWMCSMMCPGPEEEV